MADTDYSTPLYLTQQGLPSAPPAAAECPVCYALVLVRRLDDHKQAAHG